MEYIRGVDMKKKLKNTLKGVLLVGVCAVLAYTLYVLYVMYQVALMVDW